VRRSESRQAAPRIGKRGSGAYGAMQGRMSRTGKRKIERFQRTVSASGKTGAPGLEVGTRRTASKTLQ